MEIRPAHDHEILAISDLHVRGRAAAYRGILPDWALDGISAESWAAGRLAYVELQSAALRTWVTVDGDRLLGFCDTGHPKEDDLGPDAAEVLLLYVEPEQTASGIGRELLAHAVADLDSRGFAPLVLWTLEGNARARRFYERNGWHFDGATRPYRPYGSQSDLGREVRYRRGG